ncbi:MAG: Methylmalonyl-CoA carboxyltransferase 5S subunit [Firmicutes bacterium ADurb.Bin356]|nr:MAG: Methylmalonyl-CoA carboxyltransferase 5S subunit [Firmicutes bacterium ADurb.Bin356]
MAKKLFITDTILRDAHQSQAATRMRTEDMLPACEILDSIGYWSLECWGGATFDSCLRFLNEDPWDRLRQLKKALPNTKLQMLFRGQNILGYKHYADDVVEQFCRKAIENGIEVVRIFDALNDIRNLEAAIKFTKKYGGHCEPAISYTISPVHNEDYFVKMAKELVQMGADTICIKDMANLLLPYAAYSLVKRLKKEISVPIHLHTHNSTGTGDMTYLMAVQAGVDIVDCALSPMGNGTAQPATEPLVATLKDTEYDTGLDLLKLVEAAKYFRGVAERLAKEGSLDPKVLSVDVNTLLYQVPGGMLSNLISQLKQANSEDKYYDVLEEIPRVRKDFGYPPLVTPTSQIVGSQAVFNVLGGGAYKTFTKESKALLRGEYGRLPGEVNEEVRKMAIGDEEVITGRPADLLKPELDKYREEIKDYIEQEEDVLSYALFPQVALKFFEARKEAKNPKPAAPVAQPQPAQPAQAKAPDGVTMLYVEDLTV